MKKLTTLEFIKKAREVHGNKYDYSQVDYVNNSTKVCIICPEHSEFWQTPSCHLTGRGCPLCANISRSDKHKMTLKEFIKKAREVHGNKYDYSQVDYIDCYTKVCIICPEHGEFWQKPAHHLYNECGCPICADILNGDRHRMSKEDFIKKAREVHGDKYDYSKVDYKNANTKVCIICPEHDEFWQRPAGHLSGKGCPKCVGKFKTTEEFIKKAREVHGNKYDYSKVEYINSHTKVHIICPEHGEFYQIPMVHMRGCGCPTCADILNSDRCRMSKEDFIKKAKEIHGVKYDYSKVEYKNATTKICIICPEHGKFWQIPAVHLYNESGCPICANISTADKQKMSKEDFIKKAREVHGDKYDYSKVDYKNATTKICIICHRHGKFWQTPNSHLRGSGCPKCNEYKLEKEVDKLLKTNNIDFKIEYKLDYSKEDKRQCQRLDFYIPSKKIAIECQGKQHYTPVEIFGGESEFEKRKKYDQNKKELCQKNGITLLYYTSEEYRQYGMFDNKTFTDLNDLLKAIV